MGFQARDLDRSMLEAIIRGATATPLQYRNISTRAGVLFTRVDEAGESCGRGLVVIATSGPG